FAPAEVLLDHRLEHADHLAVDVVDGDDEEQQQADRPAVAPARLEDSAGDDGPGHISSNSALCSAAELLPAETTTGPGSTTSRISRFHSMKWRGSSVKRTVVRSLGASVTRRKPFSASSGWVTERFGSET